MRLVNGRLAILAGCALLAAGCGGTPPLFVPATHGTFGMPFTIGISGSGARFVSDISIDGNVGTVTIGGRKLSALAYSAAFDPRSYDSYTLLAVAPEGWYVVYPYCQAGQLISLWHESTAGGAIEDEDVTGRCDERPGTPTRAPVDFPATIMPVPPLLHGFQISGPGVSISDGQPGWVIFGSTQYEVFAFATVDCTDCGDPGWREVHVVFRDEPTNRTGICFFYLFANPNAVFVQYALTLPDLGQPVGAGLFLDGATWSGP